MSRDLAVIAFDGVHLASVGLFLDLFEMMRLRVADQFSSRDDVGMQTRAKLIAQGSTPVRLAGGRRLEVDEGLADDTVRMLIHVPDFAWRPEEMAARLSDLRPTIEWLTRQHAGGAHLSATGQGAYLLAEAGVIGSGPVPLPRSAATPFRLRYPHLRTDVTSPILDRDSITLARGLAHEMSMLMRLVGRLMSATMAGTLSAAMGMEEAGTEGLSDDPLVAAGQIWLSQRAARGTRISALALHLAVSQQTVIRRFRAKLGMTPREYLRLLRVTSAQSQLRDTTRPIAQIATIVGYDDVKSFQQAFRAHTGMSASRYRAMSRQGEGRG